MAKITAFGELLVDMIGQDRIGLKDVKGFSRRTGGGPANFAVGCSRLGADVSLVSKVGKDPFGDFLMNYVRDNGVGVSQVMRSEKKTTLAFVSLDENSDPEFMFYRDGCADTQIKFEEIDLDRIKKSELFHFGSLSLTTEPIRSALLKILEEIEDEVKVSCDPNLRKDFLTDQLLEDLEKALEYVDYLIVSDGELSMLSEKDSRKEKAMDLIEKFGLTEVVNTRAESGSEMYREGVKIHADIFETEVMDTTGAGDAFAAGYLTSLLKGAGPHERLKTGNIVAACCIREKGGMSSLPYKREVEAVKKRVGIL